MQINEQTERLFGMDTKGLLAVRKKLKILGIDINDVVTFLDRDKVQLFAEQQCEIKLLKERIEKIKNTINTLEGDLK